MQERGEEVDFEERERGMRSEQRVRERKAKRVGGLHSQD